MIERNKASIKDRMYDKMISKESAKKRKQKGKKIRRKRKGKKGRDKGERTGLEPTRNMPYHCWHCSCSGHGEFVRCQDLIHGQHCSLRMHCVCGEGKGEEGKETG
jgi:hypothetical protein